MIKSKQDTVIIKIKMYFIQVEPTSVPEMVFVNPKPERKRKPVTNTLRDCR